MNRRSVLKTAIGACAALLFPWRKAIGTGNGEEVPVKDSKCIVETRPKGYWDRKIRQINRIQKLLDQAPIRWYLHDCLGLAPGVSWDSQVGYTAEFDNITVCAFNLSDTHRLVAAVAFKPQTAESLEDDRLTLWIGRGLQKSAGQYQRDKRLAVTEWLAGDLDAMGGLFKT